MKNQRVLKIHLHLEAAIGLLRNVIENNLVVKLRDLIDYSTKIYLDRGVKISSENITIDLLTFFRRMKKAILKEKKIRADIIEASN